MALVFALPTHFMPVAFLFAGALFTRTLLDANVQWQSRLQLELTGRVAALASMLARLAALLATLAVALAASWTYTALPIAALLVAGTALILAFFAPT
ncbi:hypothetical protein, partial [Streptomyces torulosus]|uniref:hypothetical protein n=1 Tax=Streptomyces torulosus TaxID=68276 RepID=UPI0006EB5749